MNDLSGGSLRFDRFTIAPAQATLCRNGQVLELRRQSFEVLRYLAERGGRIITPDEIAKAVWTTEPADPRESVGQCIKEIRRAMGEDARWIIQTVSGRGYEFKAKIETESPATPEQETKALPAGVVVNVPHAVPHAPAHAAPVVATGRSLLASALPWLSAARSAAPAWMKTGRTVLVAALVGLSSAGLIWMRSVPSAPGVRPMLATPTVSIQPIVAIESKPGLADAAAAFTAGIGTEFAQTYRGFDLMVRADARGNVKDKAIDRAGPGVRYVVTGKIWEDNDVQRLSIQLLDAEIGKIIWSEPFEFTLTELGSSARTAARVVRLLTQHIRTAESQRPLPGRPEAGHYALLGKVQLDFDDSAVQTLKALAYYERALAIDPDLIVALQGLAVGKLKLVHNTWLPVAERKPALAAASTAIDRLMTIDKRNAISHHLHGSLARARRNSEHAIASFELSLQLNPYYLISQAELGRVMIDVGRAREAMPLLDEALRQNATDNVSHIWYYWAGLAALHLGDDREAARWLIKSRQLSPSYAHALQLLGVAYFGLGEEKKARATIADYIRVQPDFSIAGWRRQWASQNPVVAQQRKRIEEALRRLGVPEELASAKP